MYKKNVNKKRVTQVKQMMNDDKKNQNTHNKQIKNNEQFNF